MLISMLLTSTLCLVEGNFATFNHNILIDRTSWKMNSRIDHNPYYLENERKIMSKDQKMSDRFQAIISLHPH